MHFLLEGIKLLCLRLSISVPITPSSHVLTHRNHQLSLWLPYTFSYPRFCVFPTCHSFTSSLWTQHTHPNHIYSSGSQTPSAWIQTLLLACLTWPHPITLLAYQCTVIPKCSPTQYWCFCLRPSKNPNPTTVILKGLLCFFSDKELQQPTHHHPLLPDMLWTSVISFPLFQTPFYTHPLWHSTVIYSDSKGEPNYWLFHPLILLSTVSPNELS